MKNITILWVDDEIDLLKPHILFLEGKDYNVVTCQSGQEALEEIKQRFFDIVFLVFVLKFLTIIQCAPQFSRFFGFGSPVNS